MSSYNQSFPCHHLIGSRCNLFTILFVQELHVNIVHPWQSKGSLCSMFLMASICLCYHRGHQTIVSAGSKIYDPYVREPPLPCFIKRCMSLSHIMFQPFGMLNCYHVIFDFLYVGLYAASIIILFNGLKQDIVMIRGMLQGLQ